MMTPLDKALQEMRDNPASNELRNAFYRLFLSTTFFLPTYDEDTGSIAVGDGGEKLLPLIMEADNNDFMMIFDLEGRVAEWAEEGVHCLALPGHVVVEMATENLHLAMNVGTDHAKQFIPEEIAWLKGIIHASTDADQNDNT